MGPRHVRSCKTWNRNVALEHIPGRYIGTRQINPADISAHATTTQRHTPRQVIDTRPGR